MAATKSQSGKSRWEEVKEDLARSRFRLAEIRENLAAKISDQNINSHPPLLDLKRVNMLIDEGKINEAEAEFQQLVAKYPDRPEGKIGLARVAEANKDWNSALKYWEQCLALFPQPDPLPWLEAKARVLIQLGREKEAEELFKPIIEQFLKEQEINL